MCIVQRCIKRLVSQSHGETYPDVWKLSGPYADSSVPYEQCHHGVGLQRDVPGKTDSSQLCREAFIEVNIYNVLLFISVMNNTLKQLLNIMHWFQTEIYLESPALRRLARRFF